MIGLPIRWGLGFALSAEGTLVDWLPMGRVCTWGGYGGSIVVMDADRRLTIAYVMNKMDMVGLGSVKAKAYVDVVYKALRSFQFSA